MKKRFRPHRTSRRAGQLLVSGLLLTLGCDSDDKKPVRDPQGLGPDGSVLDGSAAGDGSNDGDPNGDGNANGGDAGGQDAATCGGSTVEAEPVKVNILVVLDRSFSMDPGDGAPDKWTPTRAAVGTALSAVQDKISFGLQLFPTADKELGDVGCEMPADTDASLTVAVGPGTQTVSEIMSTLDDTVPFGGTPTAAALARALKYFTEGAGTSLEGERYVLLATDGGPNCSQDAGLTCGAESCVINMEPSACERFMCCDKNCCDAQPLNCLDDDNTLAQVEALKAAGISTFVVGIPGTEAFAMQLNAFAEAGGVPNTSGDTKYYAVENTSQLSSVLSSITMSLVKSCELQLESTPPDLEKVNLKIDGETIPQAGPDGWELDTSTSPPTLNIKGASCEHIKTQGAQSVEVVYGCPTVIVI